MTPLPAKILRIAILDSDSFSRNWNASLLMRDWRTRVVAEHETFAQLSSFLSRELVPIDFVIVDLDNSVENYALPDVLDLIKAHLYPTKVIAIGQKPDLNILGLIKHDVFSGYLKKSEVEFSLAWAVNECAAGSWVITPGIEKFARHHATHLPDSCVVLEEKESTKYLSNAERFKVRLAFVMSMERDTMADEMQLGVNSVFTLISRLYENIGVNDLLAGDDWIQFLSDSDPVIREKINAYFEHDESTPGKETVAYHIVTKPLFRKHQDD